ncbi:galactose mutarotase-like [Gigantopelta aegis]|uniref:galactose mutarotase-like n=1 Tax=Gigantopelta aegis TaxID=1735272 RepID=UPI001B88E3E1|nr:galactose mutarotase-like [Gigantopelta aegis]
MASVTSEKFGKTQDGQDVTRYVFTNKNNLVVKIMDYGGTITDILVPDKAGNVTDICPGFDSLQGYEANPIYMGAIIGRFADRIANGTFILDGVKYQLNCMDLNESGHFLHGGKKGFDKMVWKSHLEGSKLVLKYVSADGEEGFPGELTTTVTYELTDDNELNLTYTATTTKATPLNLTNHVYFNIAGHDNGSLDNHMATVNADTYLPMSDSYIPTGEVRKVDGLPQDMRQPSRLGDRIPNIPGGVGFVCYYILDNKGEKKFAARFEASGRFMECYTTEPGLMFYTGYYLNNTGKNGAHYGRYSAFCLETQQYPDNVHHDNFPNSILRPGETYKQSTTYKFGASS